MELASLRNRNCTRLLPLVAILGFLSVGPAMGQQDQLQQQQQIQAAARSTIQVTKWVDYSTKYGLGYLLSDKSAGVFFNDSTKIVAEEKASHFYYYERKTF